MVRNNEIDNLLCSFTDLLRCFRCISEPICIYTELFDRTFFTCTELFDRTFFTCTELFDRTFFTCTELFDRTFFTCRVLFEGTIYPVGYFFNRYSAVLTPVQIIERGVEAPLFLPAAHAHSMRVFLRYLFPCVMLRDLIFSAIA